MSNVFILVDKNTRQIRTDLYSKTLLIFDSKRFAEKHLSKVKCELDKDNTEIVESEMMVKRAVLPKVNL